MTRDMYVIGHVPGHLVQLPNQWNEGHLENSSGYVKKCIL